MRAKASGGWGHGRRDPALGRTTRRTWLGAATWGVAAGAGLPGVHPFPALADAGGGAKGLIVRNRKPLDLESQVASFGTWLTPVDEFFVRSHFGEPAQGLVTWTTEVRGLVKTPLRLTPRDLSGFEERTVSAVLQCAGNGRGLFRPRPAGVGWERGGVGHAEWTGVRLAAVLERAGVRPGAAHVHFLGADGPPGPKTPAFLRSLPLEKALHPDTLLAVRMNGEPVPPLHGGPVRLVVPGWTGNHWMKWVRWITVAREEAPGFFMQTGYRLPKAAPPPGVAPRPEDLVPVTTMNVKSLIVAPERGARLPAGRHEVRGVAWTGDGVVEKVEVGVGIGAGRTWADARFLDAARPWAWRRWAATVDLTKPGPVVLGARATDSHGETQPDVPPYNKSGYLWNGIDQVTCEVS